MLAVVADWKDFMIVLCVILIVIGAATLSVAAQSFTMIKGKVLEKGAALVNLNGNLFPTKTVSVLLENNDRVFRIKHGSVVKYAISDSDAKLVDIGSEVELLISSHNSKARVISLDAVPSNHV